MYMFDGLLVHQTLDDEGSLEVIDSKGVRALHFGTESRQSSMLLDDPFYVQTLYTKAIMALLLFNEQPKNVLMIGLGGGTIAKYLFDQFPDCILSIIEFRKSVLKIARSHFKLPMDPRLVVKIGCGGDYVATQSKSVQEIHDIIIVDAFDGDGIASAVTSELFFDHCRTLLKDDGFLVINLWKSNNDLFQHISWNIGRAFNWQVLYLPVRKRGNMIGFAFKDKTPECTIKELRQKALQLEQHYPFEFSNFVKDIKRNKHSVLEKVFNK